MELVYLWVEDYKNIKKQGFNFSPRFRCEYDEKENKLTIDENDDYIPDFFGENINITAIVGKNGSGKSSVLECILEYMKIFFENSTSHLKRNFIFLFYQNKNIFYLAYSFPFDIVHKIPRNIDIQLINYHENNPPFNMQLNNLSKKNIEQFKEEIYSFYIQNQTISLSTPFFNQGNINYDKLVMIRYLISKKKFIDSENQYFEPINISLSAVNNRESIDTSEDSLDRMYYIVEKKLEEIQQKSKFQLGTNNEVIIKRLKNYQELLTKENQNIFKKIGGFGKVRGSTNRIYINIENINEKNIEIITKLPSLCFNIHILGVTGIDYDSLSSGEKTALRVRFYIEDIIQNRKQNNFLILLDEPTNDLHPNWEKRFLNYLIDVFKDRKQNFYFILTSHSPFLLSDIPKQNIIFLDKDEKGNCKVVDGLKEKKQTFGANIHTLLSDSFFMEDGLMGEFAKSKIDDVINYLHDRESKIKSDDEAQKLIHIIGEPIVKNQLQRMLNSRRLKKVDRIDAIEESIKALQVELARLKP